MNRLGHATVKDIFVIASCALNQIKQVSQRNLTLPLTR